MKTCSVCETKIVFGGQTQGDLLFCGSKCAESFDGTADTVPPQVLSRELKALHRSNCPECNNPGPVDIYTAARTWSLIVLNHRSQVPKLCCHSCGTAHIKSGLTSSAILGWWSIPGLIFTPIQIARNLSRLNAKHDPNTPSQDLSDFVKATLVKEMVETGKSPVGQFAPAPAPKPAAAKPTPKAAPQAQRPVPPKR